MCNECVSVVLSLMAKPQGCAVVGPGPPPEAVPAVRPSVQLRGCAGALLQVCEEKPSSEEVLC